MLSLWRGTCVLLIARGVADLHAALGADDECESEGCALEALQLRAASAKRDLQEVQAPSACGDLSAPVNSVCSDHVAWSAKGGKNDPNAATWYANMMSISGVDYKQATVNDFQRLFFCAPPGGNACGLPPCTCSKPPCNTCFGGAPPMPKRLGCQNGETGIACTPPKQALDYKGMQWPTQVVNGLQEVHFFAIGDWGGMDGTLDPIEGRPQLIAYSWGKKPGPSVFPRTRWNKQHTVELCDHKSFVECYNTKGMLCNPGCGYVPGVDDQPQQLVASALRARAALKDPTLLLNVGDNFYWGGIEKKCGTPMDELSYTAKHQFDQVYEGMYSGKGLDGKPWLSVLGNHDWGGRVFDNGWDQQIAYTWASTRWVLPAPYYSTSVTFPDQGFSVDLFFLDTNFNDAGDFTDDPEHNICGSLHNSPDASCSSAGGPASLDTCKSFFWNMWTEQQAWLEDKLAKSTATWQIAVTHFPCGFQGTYWSGLRKRLGLDLLVTGHRHDQELWEPSKLGGLTCFVTGGGGGISSEATPGFDHSNWYGEAQYGFFDLTIKKEYIYIESINYDGMVYKTATVFPK